MLKSTLAEIPQEAHAEVLAILRRARRVARRRATEDSSRNRMRPTN